MNYFDDVNDLDLVIKVYWMVDKIFDVLVFIVFKGKLFYLLKKLK